MVDEWWLDVAAGQGQAYVDAHPPADGAWVYSSDVLGTQLQQAPLRVATQAALWVSIAAGAVLAAVGFAMHSAATLRARRIELAQLRAIGLTRRGLVTLVAAESLLLCVLGIVFGVSIGLLLATLVGPLVAVSPDGTPPIPSISTEVPVASIALLALAMVAVLAAVVLTVATAQRRTRPADLLRGGGEP
jgi:ABC-type lipoprotein release transport system permease subunit